MSILTRYVLLELAKVFLVCLTALTMMMLLVGVVREAASQNLPLSAVVRLLPYVLPDALRVTLPVSVLLACTNVYARMASANEVIAVKSLGISPVVLLWPAFVPAFLLSLVAVWLNDLAVTWGHDGAQRVALEAVEDIAYSMLRSRHHYTSPHFSIDVKGVDEKRLLQTTISLPAHGSSPAVTISAAEATLQSDRAEGVLRIYLGKASVRIGDKVFAQVDRDTLEIPLVDASRARADAQHPAFLAMNVIGEEVVQQQARIEKWEEEMAAQAAFQMICGDFDDLTGPEWEARAGDCVVLRNRLGRLYTEPHRRWAAGFSCLCFSFVGALMAIGLRHRDFLASFFLCFLPILVVYYPLLAYSLGAAKNGTLPPYSVWAGNVLLVLWGAWLLRRVTRY